MRRIFSRLGLSGHEGVLVVILAGVLGLAAYLDPSFLERETQLALAPHAAELAVLSLWMTLIVISAGIDLSVGSAIALSAVVLGMLHEAGASVPVAVGGALVTGALAGALNGAFIASARIHPLIVTLATLAAFRGLAEGVSHARPISGFPESLQWIGTGEVGHVPVPLLIAAVLALVVGVITSRTPLGFRVYAIGGNEVAARHCAIPVDRIKFLLYTLSGLIAALAAVILVARRNTAKADLGTGIELEVITAVVLGGTRIFGGRGRVRGTLLGVVLIHEVREFISWYWQRDEIILFIIGVILIASVLLNNLAARWRRSTGRPPPTTAKTTTDAPLPPPPPPPPSRPHRP